MEEGQAPQPNQQLETKEEQTEEPKTSLMKLRVKTLNGSTLEVEVPSDGTVKDLKDVLAKNTEVPADQQRVIFLGKVLKDPNTLQSYGRFSSFIVKKERENSPYII
jgi:ubiquilin